MRRIGRRIALLLAAIVMVLGTSQGMLSASEEGADKPQGALRLATWNVHYILLDRQEGPWGMNDWDARKGPMSAAVSALQADVLAFQEMESFRRGNDGSVNLTKTYLLERHPEFRAAASGDWRSFPSTQPIFYRHDSLRLLDQGWFFFSDTPDVIYSRTFNGSYPAFASWAQFEPLAGGAPFRVVNVHFEYKSRSNRQRSAALVAQRVAPWIDAGEVVMLAGDLNARAGARTLRILETAGLRFVPSKGASYHLNNGVHLFRAIDHLAIGGPAQALGQAQIINRRYNGRFPSDHHPVVADVVLP